MALNAAGVVTKFAYGVKLSWQFNLPLRRDWGWAHARVPQSAFTFCMYQTIKAAAA